MQVLIHGEHGLLAREPLQLLNQDRLGSFLALLRRFFWELWFERHRQTKAPKFISQLVGLLIFIIAVLVVISVVIFTEAIRRSQDNWRNVIAEAVRLGVPVPAFASSLAYYDGYRRERLPANLVQAQRDLFGAHTYERVDRPGVFHSHWGE